MKKSLVIATISLLTMGSASVLASDLTIPNTFVSGTPAVAEDVNANFAAIEDAVDDNDARITATEAAITTKANSADVYTKPQVDTALGVKANLVDVYTKTQVDLGLTPKANSADVYTKTQVDSAVGVKANAADVYNKTETYNKTEVDNALATKANSADVYTQTQVDNLLNDKADATDVATNTADIATNTTNITNNTAAISGNTADIADLLGGIKDGTCVGNNANDIMVRVGPVCVDKYEASVWENSAGTTGISADTPYGVSNDNYPASFPDTGNWTAQLYAVSKPGVIPSSNITWFQAQQACAASGKRLLTNAEWQMAAAGTPDPTTAAAGSITASNCNTNFGAKVNTGTSTGPTQCISKWGTYDMVGNVNEWVADWIQGTGTATSNTNSATYGGDAANSVQPAGLQGTGTNYFPAAVHRGGSYNATGTPAGVFTFTAASAPSDFQPNIGFRCAR